MFTILLDVLSLVSSVSSLCHIGAVSLFRCSNNILSLVLGRSFGILLSQILCFDHIHLCVTRIVRIMNVGY